MENSKAILQNEQKELSYDPAIPFLGTYPKELKAGSQKDRCTSMFIEALFTAVKWWKPPKCPSTNECINTMWYTHTTELRRKF